MSAYLLVFLCSALQFSGSFCTVGAGWDGWWGGQEHSATATGKHYLVHGSVRTLTLLLGISHMPIAKWVVSEDLCASSDTTACFVSCFGAETIFSATALARKGQFHCGFFSGWPFRCSSSSGVPRASRRFSMLRRQRVLFGFIFFKKNGQTASVLFHQQANFAVNELKVQRDIKTFSQGFRRNWLRHSWDSQRKSFASVASVALSSKITMRFHISMSRLKTFC